jgi:hypothetical protein
MLVKLSSPRYDERSNGTSTAAATATAAATTRSINTSDSPPKSLRFLKVYPFAHFLAIPVFFSLVRRCLFSGRVQAMSTGAAMALWHLSKLESDAISDDEIDGTV